MAGARRLDLKGLECPEPAIRVFREFGKLDAGEWVEAEMDSEACAYTAVELINRSGLGLASLAEESPGVFVVRAFRLR